MSSNTLYLHYQEQLESFDTHLSQSRERFAVEDIHQLRVDIKKIRAILTLMELASSGEFHKRKHFKLFSRLFDSAGILREIHVNQAILDELDQDEKCREAPLHSAITSYRDHLLKRGESALRRLDKGLAQFNRNKLTKWNRRLREEIEALDDKVVMESSTAFISNKIEKIHKLRDRLSGDRQLHKIRAHLKSMAEVYRLDNRMVPDAELQRKIESLKKLESLIGMWHDYTVLISSMGHYAKMNMDRADRSLLEVIGWLGDKSREMRAQIVIRLDEIFYGVKE